MSKPRPYDPMEVRRAVVAARDAWRTAPQQYRERLASDWPAIARAMVDLDKAESRATR